MRTTHLYLLVGLFLGTVLAFESFAQFVLVGLCGLAGLVAGQGLEGPRPVGHARPAEAVTMADLTYPDRHQAPPAPGPGRWARRPCPPTGGGAELCDSWGAPSPTGLRTVLIRRR
ncbi:hypothetical protein [Actinomyces trachealis]|uniref:hypothetical protein n=1 Tax=Actinomyces trachealis TaxID=2763540 RepID=UPI0018C65442|nr:hypothetical protein [Actinomyces trachealis]